MCNATNEEESGTVARIPDPPDTHHISKKGRVAPQFAACLVASFGTLAAGATNGWTAGTLPSLQEDPDIHMGTTETSLMAGVVGMGAIVGSPIAGRVMDCIGRRTTILLSYPMLMAGWLLMALAPQLYLILLGRAICGLMTAFLFPAVTVYNSETPEARLRGSLGTLSSLFLTFGVSLSYTAGAFLPWRYSCYVCLVPAVLGSVTMIAIPESPYWFMLKNRRNDAEAALRWLRGPDYDIKEDVENIAKRLEVVGRKIEYRELLRPRTRRPFFIALYIMTLQQCVGTNILMIYTGTIFVSAGVENYHMATVYTGLIQLVGTFGSMLVMDRMGRRLVMVVSTLITGVFTTMLAVYYYMQTVVGTSWPQTVPLVAVLMAVLGYSFGCRTVPWLACTELFNTTIRSTANTVCIFYNRLLNYIIVQIFPFLVQLTGDHTVFFVFGSFCFIFSVLTPIIVPETRGKSLEQIQDYFEGKSKKNQSVGNAEKCPGQPKTEEKVANKLKEIPITIPSPTSSVIISSTEELNTPIKETTKL